MLVREAVVYAALLIHKEEGCCWPKGAVFSHEAFCEKPHYRHQDCSAVQATSPYIPVAIFLAICGDQPVIKSLPRITSQSSLSKSMA